MNIMNEHGIYHENLSVHNMSPLVEFSDNSHVIIRGKEEWVKSPEIIVKTEKTQLITSIDLLKLLRMQEDQTVY